MVGPNVIKLYLISGDEEEETMSNLALEVRGLKGPRHSFQPSFLFLVLPLLGLHHM